MLFAHINHLCFEVVSCIHDTKKIIVQSLVSFSISSPLSHQKQEKLKHGKKNPERLVTMHNDACYLLCPAAILGRL